MTITVQSGDSPKIYALVRDIYGNAISLENNAIIAFKYSVYKIVSGVRVAVEGFSEVDIPTTCYHKDTAAYPSNITGLTTSEIQDGYNIELFPYIAKETNGDAVWESPFKDAGTTYEINVILRYIMSDAALVGSASINKTFSVRVLVGS